MKFITSMIAAVFGLVFATTVAAGGALEEKQAIDGYTVTFHIARAKADMEMGGSHDVIVNIEKGGKTVIDAQVNSKVIHPDGKEETKMMMPMGDSYMAGYSLGHAGKHQVIILFKTKDGAKHSGGVYFSND
ncbi:MAG: hypothetical protein HY272_08590 [Gammaproteobacteria bacterium]|nr:hypothetical protein [Gammaproteobacteria bacterium]